MTRKKTLPLTYDSIFKKIFDCDIHPERLSRLISSITGIFLIALDELIKAYPWLKEIYVEISEYLNKPEEVLNMLC